MWIRVVLLILGIYSCPGFLAVSTADAHRSGCPLPARQYTPDSTEEADKWI